MASEPAPPADPAVWRAAFAAPHKPLPAREDIPSGQRTGPNRVNGLHLWVALPHNSRLRLNRSRHGVPERGVIHAETQSDTRAGVLTALRMVSMPGWFIPAAVCGRQSRGRGLARDSDSCGGLSSRRCCRRIRQRYRKFRTRRSACGTSPRSVRGRTAPRWGIRVCFALGLLPNSMDSAHGLALHAQAA